MKQQIGTIDTIDAVWSFALSAWARPGVEAACLEAQNRFGADVILMMLLLWLDEEGRGLDDDGWQAVLALAKAQQATMMAPMRERRRAAKGTPHYDRLKQEELATEHDALDALMGVADGHMVPGDPDAPLLARYAAELGLTPGITDPLKAT